jgi:chromosome segregation ATPase
MSEIEVVRDRIGRALAAVAAGIEDLEQVRPGQADAGEVAALRQELAEERIVQAQHEERIRALKERHDRKVAELESVLATERDRLAGLDHALQGLRQSNADLRELTGHLRAALTEEVADPGLVNRALLAEIEALRATRAADLAEIEAVYDALRPHLGEAM